MQKDHEDFKQPLSKVNVSKNTMATEAAQLWILLFLKFWREQITTSINTKSSFYLCFFYRVLDTSEQESLKIQKQKRAALAKLER